MINTNCGKPFQLTIILTSSSESKFEFFLLVFAFGIFKFWIWILNLHFVITRVRLWYPHTRVVLANREMLRAHDTIYAHGGCARDHKGALVISAHGGCASGSCRTSQPRNCSPCSRTGGAPSILLNMFESAVESHYWCLDSSILHV